LGYRGLKIMARKVLGIEDQRREFLLGAKAIYKAANKFCEKPADILGIDPSISSTGFALRKNGIIKTGKITQSTWGFSRLIHIEKELRKILENSNPFVAIEGYAMNAKWGREKAGEVGGVIRRLLYFKKRPLLVISPLTIKAWVKAKGKETVMLEILARYKVKIVDNDAADAFIIQEICHKAVLLSKEVAKSKIKTPKEVKDYLKEEGYKKNKELESLFRYQETSLFKIILSQWRDVEFFSIVNPREVIF
jgi:Holliday junction resolvasome RuvABC endonuclease subunit